MSKGERGCDRESVYNVGDNFTFTKVRKAKKKDTYYTCHGPVAPVALALVGQVKEGASREATPEKFVAPYRGNNFPKTIKKKR